MHAPKPKQAMRIPTKKVTSKVGPGSVTLITASPAIAMSLLGHVLAGFHASSHNTKPAAQNISG